MRSGRLYVRALGLALVLQGVGGAVLKLLGGRSDDLAHNALHLVSGLLALVAPPQAFALAFGVFYLALGGVGWVWSNPFGVLPLGPGDHLFHLAVGGLTLAVGTLTFRRGGSRGRGKARLVACRPAKK